MLIVQRILPDQPAEGIKKIHCKIQIIVIQSIVKG